MSEALIEISRAQQLMTWGLMFIVFITFLALVWSAYVALLVRREGHETRREISEILKEMREDSKRMQFYLFSKFGPADLK
jgi:hypothetical protein